MSNAAFTYAYTSNSALIATITGPLHTVTNTWEAPRDVLAAKTNVVKAGVVSSYAYAVNSLGQSTDLTTVGAAFDGTNFRFIEPAATARHTLASSNAHPLSAYSSASWRNNSAPPTSTPSMRWISHPPSRPVGHNAWPTGMGDATDPTPPFTLEDIHCLGVAEGNVRILHWDDPFD